METTKERSKSAITDLQLVEAIKSGDKAASNKAFNALYKKYHDSMLFHFKGLVKDEETAKELVLEAFTKVSLSIEKYNQETSVFSTWLFKLTQNLFIDRLRKKKYDVVPLSDMASMDDENRAIEFEVASEEKNPEDGLIISERNKRINAIINAMENKELAEVIKMRFFDGLSYEEISETTGKPLGTIKAFLHRAKHVLKREFTKANLSL